MPYGYGTHMDNPDDDLDAYVAAPPFSAVQRAQLAVQLRLANAEIMAARTANGGCGRK